MVQEQLFTDLTAEQAETIAAAIGPIDVSTSYGAASALDVRRTGRRSFRVGHLLVKDNAADGDAVYAKLQGLATDGSVLITPTKRFDRNGAKGRGTIYHTLKGSFGKNITSLRMAIYQNKAGRDPITTGDWVNI